MTAPAGAQITAPAGAQMKVPAVDLKPERQRLKPAGGFVRV
jgi:hypothetical protein